MKNGNNEAAYTQCAVFCLLGEEVINRFVICLSVLCGAEPLKKKNLRRRANRGTWTFTTHTNRHKKR